MTYQSRFGARAATPRPTGSAELFKRRYRLLYLSRRKASCRETKDVPYLEVQGHSPPHSAEGRTGDARRGPGEQRRTSTASAQTRAPTSAGMRVAGDQAGSQAHLPYPLGREMAVGP